MTKHNKVTLDELNDHLTNVINARESYPEDSLNKRAIALDNDYLETTNAITTLTQLIADVKAWISDDTHRKEIFTDIKICCEDDNIDANDTMAKIIDERYTIDICNQFLDAMKNNYQLCYAGWTKDGVTYPIS